VGAERSSESRAEAHRERGRFTIGVPSKKVESRTAISSRTSAFAR